MIKGFQKGNPDQIPISDTTLARYCPSEMLNHPSLTPTRIRGVVNKDGELVQAFGTKIMTNGELGVDLLNVPPHSRFPLHTHPGHHLLFILQGTGTLTLDGTAHPTSPGDLLMVEGEIPHAVGTGPEGQGILAFGSPHTPLDSPQRMTVHLEDAEECAETIRKVINAEGMKVIDLTNAT